MVNWVVPYFLLQLILLRWSDMKVTNVIMSLRMKIRHSRTWAQVKTGNSWNLWFTNALAPQHVHLAWTDFVKVTMTYNDYKNQSSLKRLQDKIKRNLGNFKDPRMTLQTFKPVFFDKFPCRIRIPNFWKCEASFLCHDANIFRFET